MIGWLLSVWERVALYLPVALMGLLALGTYWLIQSTPVARLPAAEKPLRHEPDYFMKAFSARTFVESGRLEREVFGAAARHYPASDTLEIDQIRIRSFDLQGRLTTATANRALTNGDATEIQLFGNALVVREAMVDKSGKTSPRLEFRGDYLRAFTDSERIDSTQPVKLRHGSDVFSADALEYDNQTQIVVMRGQVKGTIAAGSTN